MADDWDDLVWNNARGSLYNSAGGHDISAPGPLARFQHAKSSGRVAQVIERALRKAGGDNASDCRFHALELDDEITAWQGHGWWILGYIENERTRPAEKWEVRWNSDTDKGILRRTSSG